MEVIKKLLPLIVLPFVLFGDLVAAKKDSSLQGRSKTSYGLRVDSENEQVEAGDALDPTVSSVATCEVQTVDENPAQESFTFEIKKDSKKFPRSFLNRRGRRREFFRKALLRNQKQAALRKDEHNESEQVVAAPLTTQSVVNDGSSSKEDETLHVVSNELTFAMDEQPAQDSSTFKIEIKKRPGVKGGSKKTRPYLSSWKRKKDERKKQKKISGAKS